VFYHAVRMLPRDRTPLGALEANFRHQLPSPLSNRRFQLSGAP
jgi:hypothetical protein